jgi:membrane associated rhomboid family serine protease
MLILPLHRPLTLATFPVATALLMLANIMVFFGFQAGDGAAIHAAQSHYVDSGLGALEEPAYERWLERRGRHEELRGLRAAQAEARVALVAENALTDVAFVEELRRGTLFEGDAASWRRWQALRPRYEEMQAGVFTLRHVLRSNEIDPWRMVASAFLHGGPGHLFGNLLFLAALGLLVEGALGPLRFLGVYILGALGSSAISLAWRWGEAGGGLGASGAIAALMGAFCVVWGREPVRFFYWFGVVFDYVRAPAIWLLPVWLGWEVYNLLANPHLGIGFDAHAGGLLTGAALGALLVAARQVREDFIAEPAVPGTVDARWTAAQAHLGRMELAEADALLHELQQESPGAFEVALARYRVARNGNQAAGRRQRAEQLMALRAPDRDAVRQQAEVARDEPGLAVDAATRLALARRWLEFDRADEAEALLAAAEGGDDALAQALFELGLHRDRHHQPEAFERTLRLLLERHPRHALAAKARFLLDNR